MRKDNALQLVAIGLAIILFVVGYLVRTLPFWVMTIAFICGGLLLTVGILGLTGIRGKFINRIKNIKFQSPITRKTEEADISNQILFTDEQKELLDFFELQKDNWKSYIRLKLVKVESHTKAASPYLVLTLEVHNYLPVSFKLVRVLDTEGSVGKNNLPSLPENIDKKIGACSEDQFEIKVDVHGTKIPEFLQSKEALGKPCPLQWYLKGVWYADIYGKTQPIKYKADSLWCECLLSIRE